MRHRKGIKKLSRATDQRLSMLRAMAIALFKTGKIKTSEARAKEVRRMAEKIVTLAKKGDLAARQRASAMLPDKAAIKSIFSSAPERFEGRPGGYTRITKLGFRRGDNAPLALLELM